DVSDPGVYYYTPVLWAVENGVTKGVSANTFGVDQVCSRAQIVTFLYRTYNK
ncbi:MAG: S-layer homology domain-containing protein, partial [Oscillospiraceae bacterium]|nr:S-layer homology domain-containing protein [Oscillospiraceae bacterium]